MVNNDENPIDDMQLGFMTEGINTNAIFIVWPLQE